MWDTVAAILRLIMALKVLERGLTLAFRREGRHLLFIVFLLGHREGGVLSIHLLRVKVMSHGLGILISIGILHPVLIDLLVQVDF